MPSRLSRKGLLAVYIFYYLVSRTFNDKNDKNQILGNNVLTASSVIIKHSTLSGMSPCCLAIAHAH